MSSPSGPDADPPFLKGLPGRLLLVLAALTVAAVAVLLLRPDDPTCAEGVEKVGEGDDRQCVGLTDGSHAFHEGLAHVSEEIAAENAWVDDQVEAGNDGASYASVVYLMPLAPQPNDSNTIETIRHELEGAFTAQHRANHEESDGSSLIKLLLAHTGATEEQQRHTVEQVVEQRDGQRIVAVAGLGTSLDSTEWIVEELTKADIPSFGSVLTSDSLADTPGLVRVAPPNADQAAAAVRYLSQEEHRDKEVLIIQDVNENDPYTRTLAREFAARFPAPRLVDGEPFEYDSSHTDIATYFSIQSANLCLSDPDVIYYAGRSRDLPDLLAPLKNRQCNDKTLTVLSGDDTSQATQQDGFDEVQSALRTGNIELVYTGLAHPDMWEEAPEYFDEDAIAAFADDGDYDRRFSNDTLHDGQAIMGYDAVRAAVRAITTAGGGRDVTSSDVFQMLTSLRGANAVPGASGWISLHNDGSPENKAIPIIRIDQEGHLTIRTITSASGTPYIPELATPEQ
ncbi:ABC transporter substrate-binding protein [Streptomyces johnsoniae]|uniref:ABC transporter substrate-binding protein n=1 Tax=Streptomyces johnsoniae TaxID=3075532 RepID=A0ABU2SE29_9ACTN|nr:ABC transporter substrate-binding protein [Streptomyces sp. DSM 41886]MDT0447063.1 ABC transporter substrate-binding protein [Streptomyces sp. DSM 41886]